MTSHLDCLHHIYMRVSAILDQSPQHHSVSACGCVQVCGVHGSWHLGQLQIGLSRPIKLAQCRTARITLLEAIPVQMDGEPWHQPPATLEVSLHGQVCRTAPPANRLSR